VDFVENLLRELLRLIAPLVKAAADVRQAEEDAVLPDAAVDDKF